jgi:hypothetical protein
MPASFVASTKRGVRRATSSRETTSSCVMRQSLPRSATWMRMRWSSCASEPSARVPLTMSRTSAG